MNDIKSMNISPQFVFGLDKILDFLENNQEYEAKFGLITIKYEFSSNNAKIFTIIREKEETNEDE